jgi:hypothetical protein
MYLKGNPKLGEKIRQEIWGKIKEKEIEE